jgi:hypothetical protein
MARYNFSKVTVSRKIISGCLSVLLFLAVAAAVPSFVHAQNGADGANIAPDNGLRAEDRALPSEVNKAEEPKKQSNELFVAGAIFAVVAIVVAGVVITKKRK